MLLYTKLRFSIILSLTIHLIIVNSKSMVYLKGQQIKPFQSSRHIRRLGGQARRINLENKFVSSQGHLEAYQTPEDDKLLLLTNKIQILTTLSALYFLSIYKNQMFRTIMNYKEGSYPTTKGPITPTTPRSSYPTSPTTSITEKPVNAVEGSTPTTPRPSSTAQTTTSEYKRTERPGSAVAESTPTTQRPSYPAERTTTSEYTKTDKPEPGFVAEESRENSMKYVPQTPTYENPSPEPDKPKYKPSYFKPNSEKQESTSNYKPHKYNPISAKDDSKSKYNKKYKLQKYKPIPESEEDDESENNNNKSKHKKRKPYKKESEEEEEEDCSCEEDAEDGGKY